MAPSSVTPDQAREHFGLDYCLGGNRDLQAEMSQKGITLDHLVEALEQSASDGPNVMHRNWMTASLTELKEHEHESAGQALARMRVLTDNNQRPADACPTFATLYEALEAMEKDLHEHIHLENNILFPAAVELETAMTGA